ncbi:MAG: DUF2079 domain-containing protein [Bacteroidota bacterium]
MKIKSNEHKIAYMIMVFFAIIFCSISLVNHYNFRTYSLDLGLHNHAMYDYRNLRPNYSLLLVPLFSPRNQLSDHFDLMVVLLSPLSFIFGNATLLVAQIAAVILGGFGTYKYFKSKAAAGSTLPNYALFHFYSIWGIYSALSFDYHSSVIGAMLVPWYFYFFDKRNVKMTILFFVLIIICKEIMGLWLLFINLGLVLQNRKDKQQIKKALAFAGISLVYFFSMISFVIPALSPTGNNYIHFSFDVLGKNPAEAIKTILTRFQFAITLLFESNNPNPKTFAIKTELHFYVLLAGGFALFLKPQYLIMLISIYAQKLFNTDPMKWGLNYHYSIEFVPIITFALYTWLIENEPLKHKERYALAFVLLTFGSTIASLDHRYSVYYDKVQANFFDARHYKQSFDVSDMHAMMSKIPADAKVSASAALVPHISLRDTIYTFPGIQNADLILIIKEGSTTFPLTVAEFKAVIKKVENDTLHYNKVYDQNDLLIFKNKNYITPINFNN